MYRKDTKNAFSRRRKGLSGEFVLCGWAYKMHKIKVFPNLDVQDRPTKDPDVGLVPIKTAAYYNDNGLSWLIDKEEIVFDESVGKFIHGDDIPFVFFEELKDKNGREFKIYGWCSAKDLRWHWDQGHFVEPDLQELKRNGNKKAIYLHTMKDHATLHDMEEMNCEQWQKYLTTEYKEI